MKTLPPIVRALSKILVKKAVLGLQNPVTPEKDKYKGLLCATGNLIGEVKGGRFFKLTITFGRLKGRVRTVKKIGMPQMTQIYR